MQDLPAYCANCSLKICCVTKADDGNRQKVCELALLTPVAAVLRQCLVSLAEEHWPIGRGRRFESYTSLPAISLSSIAV